jgi:hypothetical protein
MVRMVIAMTDGWALWKMLEPGDVDDEMYESLIEVFTVGIGAMAGLLDQERAEA